MQSVTETNGHKEKRMKSVNKTALTPSHPALYVSEIERLREEERLREREKEREGERKKENEKH